jgi:hypothetical protein
MSVLRIIIPICLLLVSFKTYNHKIYYFQNNRLNRLSVYNPIGSQTDSTPYNRLNRLSVYNPIGSQTDSTPLITASIDTIDTNTYNNDWIAISRDLHVKYGGLLSFGDSIYIYGKEDKFKGLFIVRDLMNKRFKNSMDVCHLTDKLGLEINVKYQIINKKWKQ